MDSPDDVATSNSNAENFNYGWKCLQSKRLQYFNKPFVFLIVLCISGFLGGLITYGYTNAVITSLEKEFGLKSSQSALFHTIFQLAGGVSSLFVGYICSFHKPRYIGYGVLLIAVGSAVISVPKYVIGRYKPSLENVTYACIRNNTQILHSQSLDSGTNPVAKWTYQLIFNLGFVLQGIGSVPLGTIARAQIDDITDRGQGAMYLGIFMTFTILGKVMGYVVATPILRLWVDFGHVSTKLTPSHPNWLGAWWIGYVIGAVLLLLPLIPMLGFPRQFPGTEGIKDKKRELPDYIAEDEALKPALSSIKALLKNPTFVLISIANAAENLYLAGFAYFVPKLFETRFYFDASYAALSSGLIGVVAAVSGMFTGAYLIRKYEWNCAEILKRGTVVAFITILTTGFILVGCQSDNVATPLPVTNWNAACNINCNCTSKYHPICSSNKEMYYSPCHAGCFPENEINATFYNCSCFASNQTTATNGRCSPKSCNLLPLFVVGMAFMLFVTHLNNVPFVEMTLRIVNDGQGSAATGLQSMFTFFLGVIPSSSIYGVVIDKSCVLWQTGGDSSNCLQYNELQFGYHMFAVTCSANILVFICLLTANKFYKLPNRTIIAPAEIGMQNIASLTED